MPAPALAFPGDDHRDILVADGAADDHNAPMITAPVARWSRADELVATVGPMGFEAVFGQQRLRHEAGEAGNAQEWWALDLIDLENNTVTLRRPATDADERDDHDRPAAGT